MPRRSRTSPTQRHDALGAWTEYRATGHHVTADEADMWLARLEAGEDAEPPTPHACPMTSVIWTPAALRDVARLHVFLASKYREAARRAIRAIRLGGKALRTHPENTG